MKDIITSIRRAPYQSTAAFLVLFFTLLLSTALFISLSFLHGLLNYVETRPQVTVYFQPKATEKNIFSMKDNLAKSDKVESVKYVSKQEAFKIYKEVNKDNPLLLEMVSSDILPASLEIFAKKAVYLPEIAQYLKKQPGVDEVQFQKDILDRLLSITSILRKTTAFFFIFLMVMAVIVLTTTTLFKIAMKKEEIELMRFLGASNYYIQKPFLAEGLFFGLSASALSFLLVAGIFIYLNGFLTNYLKGITHITLQLPFYNLTVWPINVTFLLLTFVLSTVFGITIATIATLIATKKYLS